MELTRRQESLIRSLYTRHGRRKAECCVCEGVRAAGELFSRAPGLVRFTVATESGAAELPEIPGELCLVSEAKMRELSGTVRSQGVLAVATVPPEPADADAPADPFLLALDRVGDPGKLRHDLPDAPCGGTHRALVYERLGRSLRRQSDPGGDGAQFALKLRGFDTLEALRGESG
jgi:TrmH family RNA methyltransferase